MNAADRLALQRQLARAIRARAETLVRQLKKEQPPKISTRRLRDVLLELHAVTPSMPVLTWSKPHGED